MHRRKEHNPIHFFCRHTAKLPCQKSHGQLLFLNSLQLPTTQHLCFSAYNAKLDLLKNHRTGWQKFFFWLTNYFRF